MSAAKFTVKVILARTNGSRMGSVNCCLALARTTPWSWRRFFPCLSGCRTNEKGNYSAAWPLWSKQSCKLRIRRDWSVQLLSLQSLHFLVVLVQRIRIPFLSMRGQLREHAAARLRRNRSEEHTSELQSPY